MRLIRKTILLLFFLLAAKGFTHETNIYVVLWFDTEDYLLPASDDSAKRLAELLSERNIRATFKVVGEKARTLERRGRFDVITSLKKHDIGYHSNFHSVHPTPAEYLANAGLLDGIEDFTRREGTGAADVRRIFGIQNLACYGQPGSSWAPQAIAALPQIGVSPDGVGCYVDDGTHIGLGDQPFWYENAIVVYRMGPNVVRVNLHEPDDLKPAEDKITRAAENLRSRGGGLISIYYHPCEWVHREFWDGVNFRRGANPPREEWKAPGQLSAGATEAAFKQFTTWVDYIRTIPNLTFVTASQLPTLYRDPLRQTGATDGDLQKLSEIITNETNDFSYIEVNGKNFSPCDQFELLAYADLAFLHERSPALPRRIAGLLGPARLSTNQMPTRFLTKTEFSRVLADVCDFISREKRVPSEIFIGPDAVPPGDFLVALGDAYSQLRSNKNDLNLKLGRNRGLVLTQNIAADTPGLFGNWIIHKEGFRAPKLLDVARLQTWTLKPAILADLNQ